MLDFLRILTLVCIGLLVFLSFTVKDSFGEIREVNQANIQMNLRRKKFLILYVMTKKSEQSRFLYPKFLAASQIFEGDKDVIFGRIRDTKLIKEMGVKTFPSIFYYGPEYKEPAPYDGDISVDGIVKLVVDKAKNFNYSPHDTQYVTELDSLNFEEITETPKQFKMVLLYKKEHEKELNMMEELANIFKDEDRIVFARIDIDKQWKLQKHFKIKVFPALYWYADDTKPVKARYGGDFDKHVLLGFFNDHTGNSYEMDGSLSDEAGRIPEMDKLISDNIESIRDAKNMKYVVNNARKAADFHKNQEFADYYVHLFEQIMERKSLEVIANERSAIFINLGQVTSHRKKTTLKKKQNILNFFADEVGKNLMAKAMKGSEIVDVEHVKDEWKPREQTENLSIDEIEAEESERESADDAEKKTAKAKKGKELEESSDEKKHDDEKSKVKKGKSKDGDGKVKKGKGKDDAGKVKKGKGKDDAGKVKKGKSKDDGKAKKEKQKHKRKHEEL